MAESDHEPLTSESGIRKFFRGILPHWPHSSPQGGATPIHNETAETGNEGILCKDTSNLKRKSSLLQNDDKSDDSDYEENLPSCKRQRITVSAMSRLFAEFSLRDREDSETPSIPNNENDSDTPASYSQKDKRTAIPEQKSQQNLTFHDDTDEGTYKTQSINNNNDEGIPDMNNKTARLKQVKRDNKSTDLKGTPEGKRQKTDLLLKQNDKDIQKRCDTTSEETVKTNKRQAEINDSETEENEGHVSKVKRTRRLRRGLRLCTNITCYIEQVLYN